MLTYNEYMKQRAAGKDAVSCGYCYGHHAAVETQGPFTVVVIDDDCYSVYTYRRDGRRYGVDSFREGTTHDLRQHIGDDLTGKAKRWWKRVFYSEGGHFFYDTFYDGLPVAEGESRTLGSLVASLSETIGRWGIEDGVGELFLTGSMATLPPIAYVCQQCGRRGNVNFLNVEEEVSMIEESNEAVLPPELVGEGALSLRLEPQVGLSAIVGERIRIGVPLVNAEDLCLTGGDKRWKDLFEGEGCDYSIRIGGRDYEFKNVVVRVTIDVFGNVRIEK